MGSHPCAEDRDFILDIEVLPKIKYEQAFERPNDEYRQVSREGVPEVQHGNSHVDDGAGVGQYSNPVKTGGLHGGVAGKSANPNAE